MAGHACLRHSKPSALPCNSRPLSSSSTGATPKNGSVAHPGFSCHAPGSAVIIIIPVSVYMATTRWPFRYQHWSLTDQSTKGDTSARTHASTPFVPSCASSLGSWGSGLQAVQGWHPISSADAQCRHRKRQCAGAAMETKKGSKQARRSEEQQRTCHQVSMIGHRFWPTTCNTMPEGLSAELVLRITSPDVWSQDF